MAVARLSNSPNPGGRGAGGLTLGNLGGCATNRRAPSIHHNSKSDSHRRIVPLAAAHQILIPHPH